MAFDIIYVVSMGETTSSLSLICRYPLKNWTLFRKHAKTRRIKAWTYECTKPQRGGTMHDLQCIYRRRFLFVSLPSLEKVRYLEIQGKTKILINAKMRSRFRIKHHPQPKTIFVTVGHWWNIFTDVWSELTNLQDAPKRGKWADELKLTLAFEEPQHFQENKQELLTNWLIACHKSGTHLKITRHKQVD